MKDAQLQQPRLWYYPHIGWFVGTPDHLGDKRGSIFAETGDGAPTPADVATAWVSALPGAANLTEPLPGFQCLADAKGRAPVSSADA